MSAGGRGGGVVGDGAASAGARVGRFAGDGAGDRGGSGAPGGLRERFAAVTGVWEGTYTHLSPAGDVLERYVSRQETRLEGDEWYERIVYHRPGREPEVLDFRARFEGGELRFGDPSFEGRAILVEDRFLVFPYRWTADPGTEVVELITFAGADYKARLWQRFRDGRLEGVTVIEERRVPGETAEVWR